MDDEKIEKEKIDVSYSIVKIKVYIRYNNLGRSNNLEKKLNSEKKLNLENKIEHSKI